MQNSISNVYNVKARPDHLRSVGASGGRDLHVQPATVAPAAQRGDQVDLSELRPEGKLACAVRTCTCTGTRIGTLEIL